MTSSSPSGHCVHKTYMKQYKITKTSTMGYRLCYLKRLTFLATEKVQSVNSQALPYALGNGTSKVQQPFENTKLFKTKLYDNFVAIMI